MKYTIIIIEIEIDQGKELSQETAVIVEIATKVIVDLNQGLELVQIGTG